MAAICALDNENTLFPCKLKIFCHIIVFRLLKHSSILGSESNYLCICMYGFTFALIFDSLAYIYIYIYTFRFFICGNLASWHALSKVVNIISLSQLTKFSFATCRPCPAFNLCIPLGVTYILKAWCMCVVCISYFTSAYVVKRHYTIHCMPTTDVWLFKSLMYVLNIRGDDCTIVKVVFVTMNILQLSQLSWSAIFHFRLVIA